MDKNEEMKYLGIYFDSKFNFNAHIDYTVEPPGNPNLKIRDTR